MDKNEKKALRMELSRLLDNPEKNEKRIKEIGRLMLNKKPMGRPITNTYVVDPKIYIEMRNKGKHQGEIADFFEITLNQLHYEIKKLREKGHFPEGTLKHNARKFMMTKEEYLNCGLTDDEIRKQYRISRGTLVAAKKKWGVKVRKCVRYNLTYEEYCGYKAKLMMDKEIAELIGWNKSNLYFVKKRWAAEGKRVHMIPRKQKDV